jgi:hypothetical protein
MFALSSSVPCITRHGRLAISSFTARRPGRPRPPRKALPSTRWSSTHVADLHGDQAGRSRRHLVRDAPSFWGLPRPSKAMPRTNSCGSRRTRPSIVSFATRHRLVRTKSDDGQSNRRFEADCLLRHVPRQGAPCRKRTTRSRSRRRRPTSPAAGVSAPLSVDLSGDSPLGRGPGTVRQHDQTVELFARHLVSVPASLRRRGSAVRAYRL